MNEQTLQAQLASFLKANHTQSFSAQVLTDGLRLDDANAFTKVVQALAQLERDGKVVVNEAGEFTFAPENQKMGIFHGNEKGFGFVKYDENELDVFISPANTLNALNGDEVAIEITRKSTDPSRGPEGKVTEIMTHHYEKVVGQFSLGSNKPGIIGSIKLTDKKILTYEFFVTDAGLTPQDGEVVTADIVTYPTAENPKEIYGVVTEVIGFKDEPGIDILQIVYNHDVPHEFPAEVLEQAQAIPDHVLDTEKAERVDITDQTLVTIDSIESKDLDDAVVVWKLPNGNFHLGVHIADVSNYVVEGTPLDAEAYNRGTSVYLTDRVIPMLPRNISNGIASLNPGVERLAMSADMEIDHNGEVVNHKLYTSVMKSHARMTYKAVNKILTDQDEATRAEYQELVPMFEAMEELHHIMVAKRKRRGAIEFDAPEAKIIVDENGKPTDIELRERGLSERMIESFMLAANETVAEHFDRLHVPFLYRIHETPDGQRAQSFFEFVQALGHPVKGDPNKLSPKLFQNILGELAETPEERMVSTMMLRSMKQAKYSNEPVGHFGLGAEYYTHFTSPIRRYPDLTVHRLIKWYEKNGLGEDATAKYRDKLAQIGEDTSQKERRAVDTERDTDAMKKAEFMEEHVGETFDAVVSSVLKFGMFISLENTVEGLIHISNMTDDYYQYIDSHMALVGRRSHRIFQIGQNVKVRLVRVDKAQSALDFVLVDPKSAPTTTLRAPEPQNNGNNRGGNGRGGDKRRPNDHRSSNKPGNKAGSFNKGGKFGGKFGGNNEKFGGGGKVGGRGQKGLGRRKPTSPTRGS
ncbi:ribonuclease R [Periweissella ghanensis]|uniref:Ribonuclease R n=1 Tax=Periweissella ghanensis TaxID=467997 RepID=A0ABM8ZBR2_9LACO|nr:ribonuclease R [Periweissella ghanensis]MCM0600763.1 ribonuclease R [Periweissella ghanensis]CAH0418595.1 Ribonuclease R [Periweissella ghanensis]